MPKNFPAHLERIMIVDGRLISLYFDELPSISALPELFENLLKTIQHRSIVTVRIFIREDLNLNTALFLFISKVEETCRTKGVGVEYFIEGEKNRKFLEILRQYHQSRKDTLFIKPPQKSAVNEKYLPVTRLGEAVLEILSGALIAFQFLHDQARAILKAITNPRIVRWRELAYVTEQTGSRAMPIVGVMSFLIGLVTAFQAAVQLRQFGANIFVADLAALGLSRELSPLITAVLMAGRTTSAFTAEIGIMKINEELDALKVMNVDELQFLIVPRIAGAILAAPLLTVWSFFTGLVGAMFVAFASLEVTPISFMNEVYGILSMSDLWVGFFKSILFGLIVGVVGCYKGMTTSYSPESVGKQTTSAVVMALFLIIIADAFVTILAHAFRW